MRGRGKKNSMKTYAISKDHFHVIKVMVREQSVDSQLDWQ